MFSCGLCRNEDLDKVYQPQGSRRGIGVYLCRRCGLVQSLPRAGGDGLADNTGEAGFGNLRTGKIMRAGPNMALIKKWLKMRQPAAVLDVGASRGAWLETAQAYWHAPKFIGLEPDRRLPLPPGYTLNDNWFYGKLEDFEINQFFDFIYCSHTLEHVAEPGLFLGKLRELVTPTGLLFLEVPNLEFITEPTVLEEWFIDKHLYHFTPRTLRQALGLSGWEISRERMDLNYITLLVRPGEWGELQPETEGRYIKKMIQTYIATRQMNQAVLEMAAQTFNRLAEEHRLAVWGVGRIYRMLVKAGFNGDKAVLVDKYASDCLRPEQAAELDITHVLICSREYAADMERDINRLIPEAVTIRWNDLAGDKYA